MESSVSAGGLSPVMRKTALFLAGGVGMLLVGFAVQPRFKSRVEKPAEAGVDLRSARARKLAGEAVEELLCPGRRSAAHLADVAPDAHRRELRAPAAAHGPSAPSRDIDPCWA